MTGERRQVLAPAVLLFGFLVAHSLLETARDALFLTRLGPQHLAWAYLAIAIVALLAMVVVRRWSVSRDPRRLLATTLGAAAVGTAVLGATVTTYSSLVFVLYVWTGLIATLVVPCFWTMVDRSNRVIEAKRRFARISAGGVMGAIIGSALAGALGHILPTYTLVFAAALAFAGVAASTLVLAPRAVVDDIHPRRARAGEQVHRRSPRYLRLLLALCLVSTVTLTLVDLTFKRAFAEVFAAADLATAFGVLYTMLNLVALVIQLVATSRLLERIGVAAALTILPALITISAIGFVVTGAFLSILFLKLSDGGLRHSLHRVASEILYLPLTAHVRERWKPVVDAAGQRGGQMVAALLWFIVSTQALSTRTIAVGLAVLCVGWLTALFVVRRAYVAQFRGMVAAGEIERDVRVAAVDADSSRLLTEALSSPDELESLAALEVLAHVGDIPAFVLYHPSDTVVRRALELLGAKLRPDVVRILEHLVDHADPAIRAVALAATARAGAGQERLRIALDDPDRNLRATASVWLAGDPELADVAAERSSSLLHGSLDDRVALARAMQLCPNQRLQPLLDALLAGSEAPVLRAALRVLQHAPALASTERMLELLQHPYVRGEVRRVFVALGARGLAALIGALDDPRTPLVIRRHVPRTISRFRSQLAVRALAARLSREADGTTEFKILRALGRMRSDDPTLPIDDESMRGYIQRSIDDAVRYTMLLDRLSADRAASIELLRELLREKQRWSIEHAFRALGIVHPRDDVRSLYGALTGPSKERRAAAHEILESMLPLDIRTALFAIVDDLQPDMRRKRLATTSAGHRPLETEEQLFAALLADPSESLKCLTAHHIAERHLSTLRPHLDRLRPDVGPPLVIYAFDQAIARLDA